VEYQKRSINGDAGEYLVAYRVTKLLHLPCRLLPIDLGVDAEIELLNQKGESTGDVIKVQIKSFDKIPAGDTYSVYVDERHITYWKRFCLPLIVCCVDLSTERVFWQRIDNFKAYHTDGESKKITFRIPDDELIASSRDELMRFVYPDESKQIERLFNDVKTKVHALPSSTTNVFPDFKSIYAHEDEIEEIQSQFDNLQRLFAAYPWRVSGEVHAEFEWMKNRVGNLRSEFGKAHAELINGG